MPDMLILYCPACRGCPAAKPAALRQASVDNESHCHVCGSDTDTSLLLCCEACPFVFHTYCLKPALEDVPPGAWYCPVCQAAEALVDEAGGLDRVLAVRKAAVQPKAAPTAGAETANGVDQQQQQDEGPNEFYVKWKDRSYMHCRWVSNEVMQRAAGIKHIGAANPVSMRLRKFWRCQAEAAANGDLREAEERGQLVHGINPVWTQVRHQGRSKLTFVFKLVGCVLLLLRLALLFVAAGCASVHLQWSQCRIGQPPVCY